MEIIFLDERKEYRLPDGTLLCLGMFDGVHIGHQAIFDMAKSTSLKVAVLTFNDSPKNVLGNKEHRALTPLEKKIEIFNDLGSIDFLLVKKFDYEFASTSKEDFINIFLKNLQPSGLVAGFDYRFGQGAQGTIDDLKECFEVKEVSEIKLNDKKVSSTRIKEDLALHNLKDLQACLNRYYSINGNVEKGLQNGRTIGFPTANIRLSGNYYLPAKGVYVGKIKIDNTYYQTMINVGTHPTIDELSENLVECYIINFDGDIYGKSVEVEFVDFLREEKKFSSFNDLKKELEKNVNQTIEYFSKKHD